jgi:hypothetical protein
MSLYDHSNEPLCTIRNYMEQSESLRSHQLLGHWRNSQHCVEPEILLMCLQEPITGPYPDPYECSPHRPILCLFDPFKNYLPTYAQVFLVVSFFLAFSTNPICIPFLPHACYMSCPSHSPWLDCFNYAWWMKVRSHEAPHYALFRYHKKHIFSVLLQWPLVFQEGHWAMNQILSNDLDGCREGNLYKTALTS